CHRRASGTAIARDDRRDRAHPLGQPAGTEVAAAFSKFLAEGISSEAGRPPGPRPSATHASAAAPWTQTARRSDVLASMPCARNAPANPANTSPVPADASAGLPLVLMSQVPSG